MGAIALFFSLVLLFWHYHAYRHQKRGRGKSAVAAEGDKVEDENKPHEDDEVVPVHFIDQAAIVRTSIINYTFRYNAVLDPAKLHRGLVKLVEIPGWNKVGGRLRAVKGGKLEIHVPRKFGSSRPAVRFSHADFSDTTIDSHPLGAQLPRATGATPSVQEGCHAFRSFAAPADLPNDIKHYWTTDQPLLSLHVTSFADATLVGLTFPHSLSDAMGTAELVKAWSSVVAGKSCNVKPLQGTWEDALDGVGTRQDEAALGKFVLEDQQTRRMALAAFIGRFVWDVTTRRSIKQRHIYLPAKFMRHLRREVEAEKRLGRRRPGGGAAGPAFVSDGDLILAWGARMVMSSRSWKGCSAVICNVFDMRGRLEGVFSPAGAYLQNLILPATTVLSREDAATATTGEVAVRLRQSIADQTSDMQARRLMRVAREWFASMGTMPLFARWDSRVIACTNWTKARLLDAADVGPAPVAGPAAGATTAETPGRPVMYWGTTMSTTDNPRDCFVIYGKDSLGNYWVHGYLRQETWDLVQQELHRFH